MVAQSNLIVYSDSGTALMAIAPDGTRKHPILKRECPTGDGYTPKCTWFGDAAFSPDGSRIAVACNYCDADTEAGIWVLRADGTGLTRVTARPWRASRVVRRRTLDRVHGCLRPSSAPRPKPGEPTLHCRR